MFWKALRGQTVHSVHCKRNPQQAKYRFVAVPATSLLFFDLLCCFGFQNKYVKYCTAQNRSKNRQICEIQISLWNPQTNDKTFVSLNWAVAESTTVSGIRKFADSAYRFCGFHLHLRIPLTFCGIHLQLRNPKQRRIFACCGIRNKTNVPTKFTLQLLVRGIHWNFVSEVPLHFGTYLKTFLWNPGTYRRKIVRLSSAQFGLVLNVTNSENLSSQCSEKKVITFLFVWNFFFYFCIIF